MMNSTDRQELAAIRRRIEELHAVVSRRPVPRLVVREHRIAANAQPLEIAPARVDRLRFEARVILGGPVQIAHSNAGGGLRLTLDGQPFIDAWPTAGRGAWFASATVDSTLAVVETIPEEPLP